MAVIPNPSFKLHIELDDASPHYTITEPYTVSHVIFFLEAARFIRETNNNHTATIKLMSGETFDFGQCGVCMDAAYQRIADRFIKGKRDWYLSSVAKVEIDADNHLVVTIDPKKTVGDETGLKLEGRNITAEHVEIITGYTKLFGQHEYLPEFLKVLGASDETVKRARPLRKQHEITSLPVRFMGVDGRRITLTRNKDTGLSDIRFG